MVELKPTHPEYHRQAVVNSAPIDPQPPIAFQIRISKRNEGSNSTGGAYLSAGEATNRNDHLVDVLSYDWQMREINATDNRAVLP